MNIPPVDPDGKPKPFSFFSDKDGKKSYGQWMTTVIASSPYKDLFKGIISGVAEVYIDQPLVTLKNKLQSQSKGSRLNKPFNFKVLKQKATNYQAIKKEASQLWAGAGVNAFGQAVVAGTGMYAMAYFRNLLTDGGTLPLSLMKDTIASVSAGVVTSPFASISEMVMMQHNQKMSKYMKLIEKHQRESEKKLERFKCLAPKPSYQSTMIQVWNQYRWNVFTAGLGCTGIREILFTLSYGTASPYFKAKLQKHAIENELVATVGGGIIAGLLGGTSSHVFDTWNTQLKMGLPRTKWLDSYQGLAARNTRIALAIIWYSLINEGFQKLSSDSLKSKQTEN